MRSIFFIFVYLCATYSQPIKETLKGVPDGSLATNNTGSNGTTKESNTKNKLKSINFLPIISAPHQDSNSSQIGAKTEVNKSSDNVLKYKVIPASSVAPVHENLEEAQLPVHKGREHVIEQPIHSSTSVNLKSFNATNVSAVKDKPPVPNQNHVVPKKGVSLSPTTSSPINNSNLSTFTPSLNVNNNVTLNITAEHKKPLLLESNSEILVEQKTESKETPISISQMDPSLLNSKPKRADYIIPIIGVIFSVPLVAFLISLIYKRGADWWKYRNYKRMDFLIEGMYQ